MDVAEWQRLLDEVAWRMIQADLEPGERIEAVIVGQKGNAVVGTDRRLFVFKKGVLGGAVNGPNLASWRYPVVGAIDLKKTFFSLTLNVSAPPLPEHAKWTPHAVMLNPNALKEARLQLDALLEVKRRAMERGVPDPPDSDTLAAHRDAQRLDEANRRAAETSQADMLIHPEANKALLENLLPGESIQAVIRGDMESSMIATSRRIFVFKKGFFSGAGMGQKLASWDYRNLNGLQLETGMMTGVVAIQGPGIPSLDVSTWGGSGSTDARKAPHALWLNKSNFDLARRSAIVIRRLIAEAQQQPSTAPAPDAADQLRKLAELRDAGILTPDEFDAKKTEILARM